MPFIKANIEEIIEHRRQNDPEFRKAWDDSREEYRLIGEMIHLRKTQKITQSELANLIGTHQQVVSRIEKKDNSPSLRIFCNILNALGYELQIVKKV